MAEHWKNVQNTHASALEATKNVPGIESSRQATQAAHDNAHNERLKENKLQSTKQSQSWAHHAAANGQQSTAVDREKETKRLHELPHTHPTFSGAGHDLPVVRGSTPPPHTVPPPDHTVAKLPRPQRQQAAPVTNPGHKAAGGSSGLTGARDQPPSAPRPPRQKEDPKRPSGPGRGPRK